MPTNIQFTPGNKSRIGKMIAYSEAFPEKVCECIQTHAQVRHATQGYTDAMISNNMRTAQLLKSAYQGGRIQFGNTAGAPIVGPPVIRSNF